MIKGIQYSHYCGTELLEINSYNWLVKYYIQKNNLDLAEHFTNLLNIELEKLRIKISDLDILNEMKY
jgi:hypothetical protein